MTTTKKNHVANGNGHIKQQGLIALPQNLPVMTAGMISGEDTEDADMPVLIRGEAPIPVRPIERDLVPYDLAVLYQMQDLFVVPEYQRDYVYSNAEASLLVLMACWNIDVGKIECIQYERPDGSTYKGIIDGQQRFTAFIRFMNNQFPLPTQAMMDRRNPNSRIPVLEEGRYYRYDDKYPRRKVISPALRALFNSYRIDVTTMRNVPPGWEPYMYEQYQQGKDLLLGQRLWARPSRMSLLAKRLLAHPFWHEVYELRRDEDPIGGVVYTPISKKDKDGKIDDPGRMRFSTALEMLILQATGHPSFVNMRKDTLMAWASGLHDEQATSELYQAVWDTMTGLAHVFRGAAASSRTDGLLLYQAAQYLQASGFSLAHSAEGSCVRWFRDLKKVQLFDNASGNRTAYSIVAHMQDKWGQEQVWSTQEYALLGQLGLVRYSEVAERFDAELATR